jgi:hypothetical protein
MKILPYDPILDTVWVSFDSLLDDRALWKVLASKDTLFRGQNCGSIIVWKFEEGTTRRDSLPVPTDCHREGILYFIAADRAGNASRIDRVKFERIEPPQISITLYDWDEFRVDYRDSLYTDEDSIIVAVALDSGQLSQTQFWEAGTSSIPCDSIDAFANTTLYKCHFSPPADSAGEVTISAQGINSIGVTGNVDSDTILYNITNPDLVQFMIESTDGDKVASEKSNVTIKYSAGFRKEVLNNDTLPLAGMVLWDETFTKRDTLFCPTVLQTGQVDYPLDSTGYHIICGYVVDAADAANITDKQTCEVLTTELKAMIEHQSNTLCDTIQFIPTPRASFVLNYPNPFDPHSAIREERLTKLVFEVVADLDQNIPIEISIFDPFGNLVKSWTTTAKGGFNDGGQDTHGLLTWDGKNEAGKYVANGGYICVVKDKNNGRVQYGKIAVIKR